MQKNDARETKNYTGILETVADFTTLPSFEIIKAENYRSAALAIEAWSEGKYANEDNLPVAAAQTTAAAEDNAAPTESDFKTGKTARQITVIAVCRQPDKNYKLRCKQRC